MTASALILADLRLSHSALSCLTCAPTSQIATAISPTWPSQFSPSQPYSFRQPHRHPALSRRAPDNCLLDCLLLFVGAPPVGLARKRVHSKLSPGEVSHPWLPRRWSLYWADCLEGLLSQHRHCLLDLVRRPR